MAATPSVVILRQVVACHLCANDGHPCSVEVVLDIGRVKDGYTARITKVAAVVVARCIVRAAVKVELLARVAVVNVVPEAVHLVN